MPMEYKPKKGKLMYELVNDLETVKKILLLFHPEIEPIIEGFDLSKFIRRGAYHWMDIRGGLGKFGRCDLVISDMDDPTGLYGQVPKREFELAVHRLQFNIWRTILDSKPTNDLSGFDKELKEFTNSESYILRPQYTKILKDAGYRTKNADEWFKEYYRD
jgi:hypothetical protein